jgi:protein associated with RNAse G/E
MAQMILKGKEMIRINPSTKTKIEYSTNDGRSWMARSTSASYGDFADLTDNGKEILGMTSKGLYYSTNEGRSWMKRS